MSQELRLTLTGQPHFNTREQILYGVPEIPSVRRENGNLIVDFPCKAELHPSRVTTQAVNPAWGDEVIPVSPDPGHVHAAIPGDASVAVIKFNE